MSIYDSVAAYRNITPDQIAECCPDCDDPETWAVAWDEAIEFFGVQDVAMLIAQASHESADFTRLEESLYYSAERLMSVWPSRFPTLASARPFSANPEALANNVYGGRMGNTEPGDGWRFRGRGCIQLTGRYNYQRLADALDDREPVIHPDCLLEPRMAALSAAWFYVSSVPNGADVDEATRIINGGTHGITDRRERYERCARVIF